MPRDGIAEMTEQRLHDGKKAGIVESVSIASGDMA